MALVRLGPPGTAEPTAALWISCHSRAELYLHWGAATEQDKDNEGWGHSPGQELLCARGSRAELSRQDDQSWAAPEHSPGTHTTPLGAAARGGMTADS